MEMIAVDNRRHDDILSRDQTSRIDTRRSAGSLLSYWKEKAQTPEAMKDVSRSVGGMPFCPKCGAQADPGASFCSKCGSNLKNIPSQSPIGLSTKEKGGTLEDSVADYFRRMGFDVEPRVRLRDRFDVSHEIDVLASKKEAFGTIRVAVECKYVKTPMDIKEIRNFHDKLSALGITKGIFVSTGGFTADAESHASALGIELWDTKTMQSKT
jgi:ribosomal protein L40E